VEDKAETIGPYSRVRYMHMQKNVILEKNNDVIFIFLLSSNDYLYEEYILHYFYVITYTFTLHLSFTWNT